jgi:hypothetical protein
VQQIANGFSANCSFKPFCYFEASGLDMGRMLGHFDVAFAASNDTDVQSGCGSAAANNAPALCSAP